MPFAALSPRPRALCKAAQNYSAIAPVLAELVEIVVIPGRAKSAPPFHGAVPISQRDPIDGEQRVPRRDLEKRCARRVRRNGAELLLRLEHPHPELRFEIAVHRAMIGNGLGAGKSLEQRGG